MRQPRLTHVRAIALLVIALGALAGCSNPFAADEASQQGAQDRTGRLLTAVEAKKALPPVASLPPGWAPDAKNILRPTNPKDKLTPARCQALDHGLDTGYLKAKAKSYATYVKPRHAVLGVGIGSSSDAAPAFGAVRAALRTCKGFQVVEGSQVTKVKILPLHLPYIAKDTLAARFAMRQGSDRMTYDIVRIRVGHNEIRADLVTPAPGRPNTKPMVTAVKNALLNLS